MALLSMHEASAQDSSLVQEALEGNPASFQLLVERYQERLFALARHYTRNPVEIEDIVQDTFLKAYARLASYQHQASFYTWIYRIATNTVLDFLKRRGRSPVQSTLDHDDAPEPVGPQVVRPDAGLERKEVARITHEVLDDLPEIFRTVLVLREFEGMAYQDIADVLGISIGTVESRLFRARARFKQRLVQRYPEFAEGD